MSQSDSTCLDQGPRHIAIIMDGNGRWAQKQGLPRVAGHQKGVENVELVVECASEIHLEVLTLFAFSSENWRRPEAEINALMDLLEDFLGQKEPLLHKHKVKLQAVGKIDEMPDKVVSKLKEVEERTAKYSKTLALALNYGSRLEVVEAVKSYLKQVESGNARPDDLSWDVFSQHLFTASLPDPDLIIRTSGETRLSNFLLLQGAYAEIHYSPVCWPEFGRREFFDAIDDFKKRERRFGMTGAQIEEKQPVS